MSDAAEEERDEPKTSSSKIDDLRWYTLDDPKKRADAVWECATQIERAQEDDLFNDLFHASLYGNVQVFGFNPKNYGRRTARAHARLSLNVVRNMTSAIVSKIAAKNAVHPKFQSIDANTGLERKAKNLELAVGGIFYQTKFYRKQRAVMRDVGVLGTGFVRPIADFEAKAVRIERVRKPDILVDREEARDGDPMCLYHRRWYDKRILATMFPGKEDIINRAGKRDGQEAAPAGIDGTSPDIVPTIEAFVRRSGPGRDDGMRVIVLDSGELAQAPWNHDYFPFPKIMWTEEPEGFFGTGLAYELAGIQSEIDDLLEEFSRAHRLVKGGWLVDRNAKVTLRHINDDLGKIIQFAGTAVPPTYIQPVAIPGDTYRYLWDLYAKAYEISGVSQLSASGVKPAGLNSGEAQRVYDDIQTERFLELGKALEDWTMDVTEQVIDRARELAEKGGLKIAAQGPRGLKTIDFARDADIMRDQVHIQVFPTSMLPNTPAGRLAFTNDLMQGKLLTDRGEALKLLGMPDTDALLRRETAPRELIERNIEKILEDGVWSSPEPLDDHELALVLMTDAIADARNKDTEPARLSMARRYVVLTARFITLQQQGPDALAGATMASDPNANPDNPLPPAGGPPGGAPPPAGPPGAPQMPPPAMPAPPQAA